MLGMADDVQLAYVAETVLGTTPATPVFKPFRYTGESLNVSIDTKESAEMITTRDTTDLVVVGGGAEGGFDFELSYGAFDDFLASVLHADWATNVLKNGSLQKSFTIEKKIPTSSSTYAYLRYLGMVANNFSLSVSAGDVVSGSFGFMGIGGTVGDAIVSGATYGSVTTEGVMNAAGDVGTLTFGSFSSPILSKIDLNISNNLKGARKITSLNYADICAGKFELSGSVEAFFNDKAMAQAYFDGTAASLLFTIGKATTKKYTINIPSLKFSKCDILADSSGNYVMAKMDFKALHSSGSGCAISITRAVA